MTPAAFRAYVRGYLEEQTYRIETRQRQDYNLAVMIRAAVGEKRMPDYERFFRSRKSRKAMSDAEICQSILALNAALGGTMNGVQTWQL